MLSASHFNLYSLENNILEVSGFCKLHSNLFFSFFSRLLWFLIIFSNASIGSPQHNSIISSHGILSYVFFNCSINDTKNSAILGFFLNTTLYILCCSCPDVEAIFVDYYLLFVFCYFS